VYFVVIGVGRTDWFQSLPPPNRACGSPAHGSPVGGLTSLRIDGSKVWRGTRTTPSSDKGNAPFIPQGIVNMKNLLAATRNRDTPRRTSTERAEGNPSIEVVNRDCQNITSSTFLVPFARPALPGVHAHMEPLTPEQAVLRSGGFRTHRIPVHERRLIPRSGLPALRHRIFRQFRLQPPPVAPSSWFAFKAQAYRRSHACTELHPLGRVSHDVNWVSPFGSRLTTTTGRIEFVILRTSRSLPVALHPLSQGRSYRPLQSSNQTLTGTSTPPIRCAYSRLVPVSDIRLRIAGSCHEAGILNCGNQAICSANIGCRVRSATAFKVEVVFCVGGLFLLSYYNTKS